MKAIWNGAVLAESDDTVVATWYTNACFAATQLLLAPR